MKLREILDAAGVTQVEVYRACKLSRTVMSRIVSHDGWPLNDPGAPGRIADYLAARGTSACLVAKVRAIALTRKTKAPNVQQHAEADPEATEDNSQEESMLLRNEPVMPKTKQHFKLSRSPFHDDVRTRDDVFSCPDARYVRAALMDCAVNHGFVALVGESGAGKSTLVEELEQRIFDEQKPVIVIRPSVLAMELNDKTGRTLKSAQIAEAIVRTVAPSEPLKQSAEARDRQVKAVLMASRAAGYSHLLLIEEAHSLPTATLKHLKRFIELKQGLSRLIGIALIGQPELRTRLSERSADVREVVQRCEIVELLPLNSDLRAYVEHKFARVGANASDVLDEGVYDALRARLIRTPRGGTDRDTTSVCYPLVVNNLLARAMNAAAAAGFATVTPAVIGGV